MQAEKSCKTGGRSMMINKKVDRIENNLITHNSNGNKTVSLQNCR